MKVRKQMQFPMITVLMISIMLTGCSKSKAENETDTTKIMQTVTAQTDIDTVVNPSTEETMAQLLDETPQETVQENSEEPTQQDHNASESETDVSVSQVEDNNEETHTEAPEVTPEPESHSDFVANLNVAKSVNQMIVVSASGSEATVTMHEVQNGTWTEIMSTYGTVGKQGVGSASEERSVTPAGIYSLSIAFGVNSNPGTSLSYTKVDDSNYWVDDSDSSYYNRFVSTKNVTPDWDSAEHLIDYPEQYAYAIAIDYNKNCVPRAGSAIFLHCSNGNATAGCVAIPQDQMVFVLNHIHSGCVIVIDTDNNISNY